MTNLLAAAAVSALLLPLSALVGGRALPGSGDAFRGPPWISIEHPVNPHDPATRGAFLIVNAYHHGTPAAFPVRGTAEGVVNGERRTVSLELGRTSRPGAFTVRKQWRDEGTWTLVLSVTQGEGDGNTAYAVVELGVDGSVASVRVPTRKDREGWNIPVPVSMADVESGLRKRVGSRW